MFDKRNRRRSAWLALAAMTSAIGMSALPTGQAEAGWRGRGYYAGGYYPSYGGYYPGNYGYRNDAGAAVAAGIVGLAAGALIGGALAQPRYYPYGAPGPYNAPGPIYVAPNYAAPIYGAPTQPFDPSLPVQNAPVYSGGYVASGYTPSQGSAEWNAYCASKYRSFDPATGTFLGYDGQRHYCQ